MLLENENEIPDIITVFKALSDPNRLRIFAELMTGNSCNCELEEKLGLARNLLSHHLRTLSKAGLVESRRDAADGRWIYYSVKSDAVIHWQAYLNNFFDPTRIQNRPFCGPEGQTVFLEQISLE